jgi:hypothetical protein
MLEAVRDNRRRCFPWGPPRVCITELVVAKSCESSVEELIGGGGGCCQEFGPSSGDDSRR